MKTVVEMRIGLFINMIQALTFDSFHFPSHCLNVMDEGRMPNKFRYSTV